MIAKLRQKSQVTIPAEILKKLKIKTGDKLEFSVREGKMIVQPVVTVPREQAWFWNEKWQMEEKIVDEQIKAEHVDSFDNIDELIEDLDK